MKTPILKSKFFKLGSARQFDYFPMYYDADKERMEERKVRIAKELELEQKSVSNEALNMRLSYERNHAHRQTANAQKWSSFRLIIIMMVLIFICYKIFINLEGVIAAI